MGTSAGLKPGDQIKLKDLFFGLMLPSGNDAALALAWVFGQQLIVEEFSHYKSRTNELKQITGWKKVTRFIKEMNKTSAKLLLKNTKFTNVNGLGDKSNKSTAEDINKLAFVAIQLPFIQEIVATKLHSTQIINLDETVRNVT